MIDTIERNATGEELFYGEQRGKVMLFSAAQVNLMIERALPPIRQDGDAVPLSNDGFDVIRAMRNGKDVLLAAEAVKQALDNPQTPIRRGTEGKAIPTTIYGDETLYGEQRGIVMEFGATQVATIIGLFGRLRFWRNPMWLRLAFWSDFG